MRVEVKFNVDTGAAKLRVPNGPGVDKAKAFAAVQAVADALKSDGIPFEIEGEIEEHTHGPENIHAHYGVTRSR